jgi:dTDP-4-dehydrorhamnose reductase
VDKAEAEPDVARAINATAPGMLAQEATAAGSILIHYSTDYVFDGTKSERYPESDPISPVSVYGKTKAEGEEGIRNSGCRHLIFRTSWVFSNRGSNFLLTMLRLTRERDQLRIVNDQIGAPTSSESLARATVEVLQNIRRAQFSESLLARIT